MRVEQSKGVVLAALSCSLASGIALCVLTVRSGSSAVFAAAIASLIAASHQTLLYTSLRRAADRPATSAAAAPLSDLYFWVFTAATLLYAMGAGVALYQGVAALMNPQTIAGTAVVYTVLGIALVVAYVWASRTKADLGAWAQARDARTVNLAASTPALYALGLEQRAALIARPAADGWAAIAIGLILATVAAIMAVALRRLFAAQSSRDASDTAHGEEPAVSQPLDCIGTGLSAMSKANTRDLAARR
jgi:hypothetical protein